MSVLLRIKEAPLLRKFSAAARQEGAGKDREISGFPLSRLLKKTPWQIENRIASLVPFNIFKQQIFFFFLSVTAVRENGREDNG